MNLQFNKITNKLRVGTYGIGAWEIQLPGDIYVKDRMYVENNPNTSEVIINSNIYVCSGGTLILPYSCNVKMAADKKIIVMSGGQIDVSSGNAVTFASQSGTWGGIDFDGSGYGTLNKCSFNNTSTPVVIN